MKSKLRKIKEQLLSPKKYHFKKNRMILENADYFLEIYESLLKNIQNDLDFEFKNFVNFYVPNLRDVYIRHDIDSLACTERMSNMFEINLKLGLPSSAFFRVDDDEYHLEDIKEQVKYFKEQGLEMGLHSVCYTKDDYLKEFSRETEKFADEVGFRPESFTVHGLGEFRKSVRKEFYDKIKDSYGEFGYKFTDAGNRVRAYDYVIEDCHMDSILSKRFIFNDFINYPKFLPKGSNLLILTHPCYWK